VGNISLFNIFGVYAVSALSLENDILAYRFSGVQRPISDKVKLI